VRGQGGAATALRCGTTQCNGLARNEEAGRQELVVTSRNLGAARTCRRETGRQARCLKTLAPQREDHGVADL